MLEGNARQHTNGLLVSIDWLGFTLTGEENPEIAIDLLGYKMEEFTALTRGASGYRKQFRHCLYPVSILYDGNEGMGIHVDITGSAITDVVKHYKDKHTSITPFGTKATETKDFHLTVFANLLREILFYGHITRLDLALDDIGAKYYTLKDLSSVLAAGNYVSKFRSYKEIKENKDVNTCIGHSIYLGSRTSDAMLRVYDKQLEQSKKLLAAGEAPIMYPWVRWEMELKRERAQVAARLISVGANLNEIIVGVLYNYFRIVEPNATRNSRCEIAEKWLAFIDGITKLSLYLAPAAKTIDKVKHWLMKQVASSLASVVIAAEGDIEFIYKLLDSGRCRLKKHHLDLIKQYQMAAVTV